MNVPQLVCLELIFFGRIEGICRLLDFHDVGSSKVLINIIKRIVNEFLAFTVEKLAVRVVF